MTAPRRIGLLALLPPALILGCAGPAGIVVASKNFTEQTVLGEILAQEIEALGLPVERRFHLGGTFVCHAAVVAGDADIYVEYTGTAWTAILGQPPVQDPDSIQRGVERAYRDRWDLAWGPPLGFENSFALVVRRADARTHGLATISDLARVSDGWTAAFGPEFMARQDGYPGLRAAYGLDFAAVRQLDLGLMYRALAEGRVDVAVANSTDGRISALALVVLRDDRGYFPPYQAAPVVRREALERHPRLWDALERLEGSLDEEAMRTLNRAVEDGRDVRAVVREWRAARAAAGETGNDSREEASR